MLKHHAVTSDEWPHTQFTWPYIGNHTLSVARGLIYSNTAVTLIEQSQV